MHAVRGCTGLVEVEENPTAWAAALEQAAKEVHELAVAVAGRPNSATAVVSRASAWSTAAQGIAQQGADPRAIWESIKRGRVVALELDGEARKVGVRGVAAAQRPGSKGGGGLTFATVVGGIAAVGLGLWSGNDG
jgi:hypothetical protein